MLPGVAFNVHVGDLHADPQACKAGTVPTEPWPGALCFPVFTWFILVTCCLTEQNN